MSSFLHPGLGYVPGLFGSQGIGPIDLVGISPLLAYSTRRLTNAHTGPVLGASTVQTGGTIVDLSFLPGENQISAAQILAVGSTVYLRRWYSQTDNGATFMVGREIAKAPILASGGVTYPMGPAISASFATHREAFRSTTDLEIDFVSAVARSSVADKYSGNHAWLESLSTPSGERIGGISEATTNNFWFTSPAPTLMWLDGVPIAGTTGDSALGKAGPGIVNVLSWTPPLANKILHDGHAVGNYNANIGGSAFQSEIIVLSAADSSKRQALMNEQVAYYGG